MASIWTKSAILGASAAFLALAFAPLTAEPLETPPEPLTGPPPSETGERQSPADNNRQGDRELQLRESAMMAARCRSGADTEAEAVADCTSQLNCQAPTPTVKCSYRSNMQDWICRCV